MTKHSKKFKEEALKLFDEIGTQRDNPSIHSACVSLWFNSRIDSRSNFELLKHAVWGIFRVNPSFCVNLKFSSKMMI